MCCLTKTTLQLYNFIMDKREMFDKYYELLVEWNGKFNLTTITEREQVDLLHFKDSILPLDLIKEKATVLDVGSGAGFPGIPIKIMRNDVNMNLIDSVAKKVNFMEEVIKTLGLKGINVEHTRVEELSRKRQFEVVLSRVVAPLNVLSEYCIPFVKTGGIMIAYKTKETEKEIKEAENAIEILGGRLERVLDRQLDENIMRRLIVIRKEKETPLEYPRGNNKPRKKPL